MDPERARIQADLRGLLEGEVYCEDLFLQMYATDASIHQIIPVGVVRPVSTADVVAAVQYARENHLSVHARGAGSNVVGGALGRGLIVDFSYGLRRVRSLDQGQIVVQPGAVLANLNRQLAQQDQIFGPDPQTRSVTTIGGVLAMNSSGSHWLRYGEPREKVLALQVVLADGSVMQLTSPRNSTFPTPPRQTAEGQLALRVGQLVERRQAIIQQYWPNTRVNNAGYFLCDPVKDEMADLARLIVGSEGTLAIITEATLRTETLAHHRGVALLFFERMETAAQAALEVVAMNVAACDLLDRRLLSIARESDARFERFIPGNAEAMVLAEFQGSDPHEVRQWLTRIVDRLVRRKKQAFHALTTSETDQRNLFWRIVRRVIPRLYLLKGSRRALPFIDDISIAPELLPSFLVETHAILNQHEVTASVFAHVGQGLIHIRPFLDLADPHDVQLMNRLADDLFERVIDNGGSISGGHGDGISRTQFLKRQYGRLYDVFREVKHEFDPQNVLNPGKIVESPRYSLTGQLRAMTVGRRNSANGVGMATAEAKEAGAGEPALPIVEPHLNWTLGEFALAANNCNGCGRCRTSSPDERMCPIFRLAPVEEASPRAKANLVRGLLTGQLDPNVLRSDDLKAIADLCVNCHQCRLECPACVDIPKLMLETKAQYVSANGLKMSEWLLPRLDLVYDIAGRFPWVANQIVSNRIARWFLEKTFGIAQARKLPRFSRRSFMRWATRRRLTQATRREGRKALYFVDAFANWNDVELGQATVEVLRHNGFSVYVPPGQNISAMSLISAGLVERARKIAHRNVELLSESVRQGFTIITTEPSAGLALTHEYLNILDDSDARLVAENTVDASTFLWRLHEQGSLELDFQPVNATIGYHLPCHQRALNVEVPGWKLLKLVPGLKVERIEKGCSGMAGLFGLRQVNYRRSLRAGVGLISAMRSPDITAGATECSTCKIQMEQGTLKPTFHPIKILALAYGLMPELTDLLNRRSGALVIS